MEIKTMFEIVKEYYIGKLVSVCLLTFLKSKETYIIKIPDNLNGNKFITKEIIELKVTDVIHQVYDQYDYEYYLVFNYNNKQHKVEIFVL
jgi:hypothetical protein